MELKIELDMERIAEIVEKEISMQILEGRGYLNRETQYGVRDGMDKAVKKYIYENKDKIIERVVDRASREIVKKGLPKLLENL